MIRFSKTYLQYFCSPYRGQKPSLPLRKVFFYLSVSPARRAPHPNQAFPSRKGKDVTALWCSEPLRYKVGGPSKVCARFCGMGPPELFLIAVSLCACRRSNEESYFYSTFDRITSGEVPIRVIAE